MTNLPTSLDHLYHIWYDSGSVLPPLLGNLTTPYASFVQSLIGRGEWRLEIV